MEMLVLATSVMMVFATTFAYFAAMHGGFKRLEHVLVFRILIVLGLVAALLVFVPHMVWYCALEASRMPVAAAIIALVYFSSSPLMEIIRLRRAKKLEKRYVEIGGRGYEYWVVDSDVLNACRKGREICVTRKLAEVFEVDELKVVLLHEEGHDGIFDKVVVVGRIILLSSLIILITDAFMLDAEMFFSSLSAYLLAIPAATLASWVNEHVADLNAAKMFPPELVVRTFVKFWACAVLRDLCTREVVNVVVFKNIQEPTFRKVLWEVARSMLDSLRGNLSIHPPPRFRIYAVLVRT
ncbi:M48 family metalloprotease [Thermofilum pendens]|nr:M48 family metalloprotease [Thermofilum pendens]